MNTHYEAAAELLEANNSGPTYIDPNTLGLAIASTQATLALAYEQRTANLIALCSSAHEMGDFEIAKRLQRDVVARLDLA